MARLVGVDLPRDKRIEVALTYIFGVGRTRALKTLEATGISGDKRVHELGDEERTAIGAIPLTTVERTLLDLATVVGRPALARSALRAPATARSGLRRC